MLAHRAPLIIVTAFLAACAHPRSGAIAAAAAGAQPASEEGCLLSTGPVSARAPTITVGLSDAVDPRHAPFARNDAERIVFRHLYETPVRVDCDGQVRPELAAQWEKADGGRRWTFRLRDGAQFWDGAPVTAQDIVFGHGGAGYTLSAPEKSVVTVTLAKGRDDVPPMLGDRGLAVTKPAPDWSWPIGTGSYWATSATTTPQEIRAHTPRGDTLVFKFAASGDARDLLDAGVDLLVTRDRALRDYAATLQNHEVVALPWDRTYVYVTAEAGGGSTRFDGLEQAVRARPLDHGSGRDGSSRAMKFRTRLLISFGVVVLIPLLVFGLGIRREMSRNVTGQYEQRVSALVNVINADIAREGDRIGARLATMKNSLKDDNNFRNVVVRGADRSYVLDYAGNAMRLSGLDFLQIQDDEGRVVSSGHFRNEFDRLGPPVSWT